MTTAERQAAATNAKGLNAIQKKNVHTKPWADLSEKVRAALLDAVAPVNATENKAIKAEQTNASASKNAEIPTEKSPLAIELAKYGSYDLMFDAVNGTVSASLNGATVGEILFEQLPNSRWNVADMGVDAKHRRKGLASAMLDMANNGYGGKVTFENTILTEDGAKFAKASKLANTLPEQDISAIEAAAAQAATSPTNDTPAPTAAEVQKEQLESELRKAKERMARVKREKGEQSVEYKAAEARVRKMRQGIFDAEDALQAAKAGDPAAIAKIEAAGFGLTAEKLREAAPSTKPEKAATPDKAVYEGATEKRGAPEQPASIEGSPDDWRNTLMKTRAHAKALIDAGKLDGAAAQAAWTDHEKLLGLVDGKAQSNQSKQAQEATKTEAKQEQFANNKLFTADKVAAARERMRKKLGTLNSGIDPELLVDGMTIAGAYIESGIRSFGQFAKAMVDDMGDGVKPYLLSFWEGARNYPGLDNKGMTSPEAAAREFAELNKPVIEAAKVSDEMRQAAKQAGIQATVGVFNWTGKAGTQAKVKAAILNSLYLNLPDSEITGASALAAEVYDEVLQLGDNAAAIGQVAPKPAKRSRKTGKASDMTLTQDWGVEHIDGYGDSTREIGNDTKDAFLKEAKQYLNAVADDLAAAGFEPHADSKGKPGKAVRVNESGMAGSGDVSLTMRHADTGTNVYVHLGDTALRGVIPSTPSGIAVMARTSTTEGDTYASKGTNQWMPVDLSASDLAAALIKSAGIKIDAPTNAQGESNAGTAVHRAGTAPLEPVATRDDQGVTGRGDAEPSRTDGQQGNRAPSSAADAAGDAEARSGGNGAARDDLVQAGARSGRGRGRVSASDASKRKRAPKTPATAKELQAEAAEEIKQASPINVPGIDFTITDEVELGKGTEGVKYADNLKAIRTLKQIEQENRRATPEEQRILARYVGWGGLKNAFRVAGASKEGDDGIANGWKARVDELEALLTPAELRAARNSTTAAHYTSEAVVGAVWKGVQRLGFNGGAVLEPSVGTGNFLGLMPQSLRGKSKVFAVEYDSLTARIAQQLYPNQTILHTGFQNVPMPNGKFALAIGNPPFGKESLYFKHNPLLQGKSIHNQFFMQSLQSLDDGGVMGMVVSHNLMDAQDQSARLAMAIDAEFVGAIRLPETAFKENARTEVVTDILFFKKRSMADVRLANVAATKLRYGKLDTKALEALTSGMPEVQESTNARVQAIVANMEQWVPSSKITNFAGSGETISLNPYFLNNPKMVLGTMDASGTMNARADLNVRLDNPADMARLMDEAIAQLPERAPMDAVAQRTMEQFEQMATAMRLAVNRAEPGAVSRTPEGMLKIVLEMDDVSGSNAKPLLTELSLTADTPFSEEYTLRSDGKWQVQEDVLGEDGKPVKKVSKLGKVTNQNEKKITVYDKLANIPVKDKWGSKRIELITDMLPLRDGFKRQMMLEASDAPTKMMEDHRKRLADLYQGFVKKHGKLHKRDTEQVAMVMPDGALVLALENVAQDGSTSPADILSRRVTVPPKPVERVTNASEAVAVVLAETGSIDIERVAKLLGTDEEGAKAALSAGDKPRAFFDPETNRWEPADGYLSGLVRRKLLAAKAAGLEANVRALEAVQPEPWDASQITPAIGSSWIPAQVYADFLKRLGFTSATVHYSKATNTFSVATKGQAAPDWRASDNALSTVEIVQRLLNSRAMKVLRVDADKKTYVDQEATAESQMKAGEIANEFLDWAFADDDRREQLVTIFNEKYNTRVQRQRDGSHLTLPGKVPDSVIKMRPWQLNAVWRGITDNAVLYDHAVGAGKTYTAIARAMERRRMGLSKKPMIVVPNHLVEQWAADVRKLYPGANILAGTKHDFEKQRRRRLFARIGAGDYDMVIVGHSSFGFIDIDPATEERYLDEELRIAYDAVKEAEEAAERDGFTGWGKPMGVAQAERLVKKLEERLAKIRDTKRDRLLTFEEMGIDDLTVDEAHEFKNLAYSSNLSGVSGMGNKTGSQKALDLNLKIRTLKEKQGTSVAFLTGTPISNSVAEMYLVLRNLMPAEMAELGFENFDAWRTNYVSATAAYEPTESGSLKEVTRLGREWSNMRSLMDLYYTVSDAVTLQDMKDDFARANPGKTFPVPKVRSQENGGGDREMVAIKPNEQQRAILRDIVNGFDSLGGITNPKDRNKERLRLMDRARKVSLDARAVDPNIAVPDGTGKIGAVVARAVKIYNQWEADKGTQLIFLDRSVPKAKGDDAVLKKYDKLVEDWNKASAKGDSQEVANIEEKLEKFDSNEINELRNAQKGGWNAYEEIKRQLVAQGIPAKEIRFVQEANTDDQKAELFRQVNAGEVRILLGSSPRMGAGTNVQERLVALHHVDVTWKPSDIEQREGRIVRQNNKLLDKYGEDFTVDVIAYATEMTVDAKMWSLNATKLKSINGVRKYEGAFNMEFEDEESASMAEMAALATGNPLMVERVVLDGDIKKLEMAQRAFTRRVSGARGQMRQAQRTIEQGPVSAARLRTFAQQMEATMAGVRQRSDARKVTVNGVVFTSDLEADLAATKSIEAQQASAGKEKGRYVVEVNGEKATSRERIRDLIADQLGDKDFEAEVDGKKFISINSAVAAIMDKHGPASTRGREFTLDGITINGMRVELDIAPSRWKANTDSVLTLVVLDADGNSMVQVSHGYESPTLSAASLRAGLNKLAKEFAPELHLAQARDQEAAVERAKRDLPELKKLAEITFPQEQELKDKRERLGEVEKALAGSSDAARLDGEVKPSATEEGDAAEEVAFSRGSEFAASPRRVEAVKLTQGVVDAMRAAWSNGPEVVVAFDMQDPAIPAEVRAADLRQRSGGAVGEPEGFYYKGKAYVLASQMRTANDVARVVAHEVLGHYGLRSMFGKDLGRILDQLATMRRAEVAAKIKEYGLSDDAKGRREAAEEVLSVMAQTTPKLGFVTRAVAAIRTWLRTNVPGFQSLRVSDAEIIRDYILPARAFVERGGPDGNGPRGGQRIEPAMSRAEAGSTTDQTQTANFKRWYGDWQNAGHEASQANTITDTTLDSRDRADRVRALRGSENVDATVDRGNDGVRHIGEVATFNGASGPTGAGGTPLRLYHGTRDDITAFNLNHPNRKDHGWLGGGIYLTSDAEVAFAYSRAKRGEQGSNVMPVYANVRNPYVATRADKDRVKAGGIAASQAFTDSLKAEGYDGVVLDLGDGAIELVAFEPTQIKSAIGNNGDFDPANPDIRFSRAKVAELKDKGLQMAHTYMSHPGKVSLWDKTVGTMRHLAERKPAFNPVFEAAQQYIDDVASVANEAAQYAPRLIPRVETLTDMRKKPISVEDNRALGKALFGGTLEWGRDQHGKVMPMDALKAKYAGLSVDTKAEILLAAGKVRPQLMAAMRGKQLQQFESFINSRFESTILKPGVRFSHKELREFFNLSDGQISLYDEARATVDKSLDMTARAEMLRALGRDWDFMRDMVMDAPTLTDAWKLLDDELEQRAKEIPDSRDQMAAKMFQIRASLDKAQELMDSGYMPLQRFGKYTVWARDKDGETIYYSMHESKADSNRMAETMRREYPDATVTQGTVNEDKYKLFAGITPETAELFGSMLGLDAQGNDAKDQAFQEFLKLSKNNHSALKRLIHRKGIMGYSEDVGRVLASFVYSNARLAATGLNAGKMENAINDLNTKHKQEGELGEIAAKLRDYIQDPQEEGQAIRGMLFAQYLGGSIASAMVNMTQPFSVTLPWLSQFGGMAKAGRYLSGAIKDMAKRGHQYEPDLAHALKMAEDDGVVSPQEIHQLMAQARGAGGLRTGDGTKKGDALASAANYWEKGKVLWGQPFALAEQFNRRSTFIAAYRLAKEQGKANPAEFARRAVVETQFLYTKANKPQWARGAIGGTVFTFKTYSVSFLELMQRTWNAGEPGSPERAAGRRAVGWAMLMLMLMGGAGGLPFVEDVEDLVDGAGQMMGYNLSSKQWRQQAMRDVLGAELADFLENGLSGLPGAPIDISGRMGMGNLIPGTGLLLNKQSSTRDVMEMIGPAGDLVARGFSGLKSVASGVVNADAGSIGRGAMEVMPAAVRNAVKGADMAASGMYKDTKGYKIIDTSLDEALWKMIGFQPRAVAQVQESNSFMQRSKSFYIQTSNEIRSQWAQALFDKDEDAVKRVRERLDKWNAQNPDQPIRIKMPDIWKRVHQMGKDRTDRIADTAPKALRQQLRDMAQEQSR